MKSDQPDATMTGDLTALAAAAQGNIATARPAPPAPQDIARAAKIAELKAKFEAGQLSIDEQALAAKLVDSLFDPLPGDEPPK